MESWRLCPPNRSIVSGYNAVMLRGILKVSSILLSLSAAVLAPVVASGYSELRSASTSSRVSEAAGHYRAAAQRIPWRPDLYELAGHAYYHAKDYANADAAYRKALGRNALSAEGWVAWGDVNYLNNDAERAAEIWERSLGRENPSDHLYSRLAQIYQEKKDYPKAEDFLQRFVSKHPEDASAHYRLGLLLTLSDPNAALPELITASRLDPQFDPAFQTLRTALNLASLNDSASERFVLVGRGLGLVEEWELARAAFEGAVRADEGSAEAWAWLGEAVQHDGLPEGGSEELDKALELNPNSSTVRGLRGLRFQRLGDDRQALAEFQAAAALEPDNPARYVSVGEAYTQFGDLIRALEAYRTATALAPEAAAYWRSLSIFCAQNNVHLDDVGIPAAQRAVNLAKDDPVSLDVLGWSYMVDARYYEAERILLRALELDPQSAPAHLHLGMLYLQIEEPARAYDHLARARDLGSAEAEDLLKRYFP